MPSGENKGEGYLRYVPTRFLLSFAHGNLGQMGVGKLAMTK